VKIDTRGYVYVTGETFSPDFVFERGLQSRHSGVQDAYLLRLDLENDKVVSSTFWGGMKKDVPMTMALGPGELVTFAGETYSDDFRRRTRCRRKSAARTIHLLRRFVSLG
jgi:hypothetical protein